MPNNNGGKKYKKNKKFQQNVSSKLVLKNEEEDVDEAMYDVLGISPSYRPKNEGGKKSKVDKRRLKKMLPELYGPGGSLEPIKQIERDQRKMKRDIQKEIDAAMGLD